MRDPEPRLLVPVNPLARARWHPAPVCVLVNPASALVNLVRVRVSPAPVPVKWARAPVA